MSACISSHGEFSTHLPNLDHVCTLCGVLDEDTLIAELNKTRAERDVLKAQLAAALVDAGLEPPDGSAVRARAGDLHPAVFGRCDSIASAADPLGHWFRPGAGFPYTWAELNAVSRPVLLVPEPEPDKSATPSTVTVPPAPGLPYKHIDTSDGAQLRVYLPDTGVTCPVLHSPGRGVWLTSKLALDLLAIARQYEEKRSADDSPV